MLAPKRETVPKKATQQDIFFIKEVGGADAQGKPTSDGFVVFKGQKRLPPPSLPTPSFLKLRQSLIDKNVMRQNGKVLEFSGDYIFSSRSTAAVMVMGRNANGLEEWKLSKWENFKRF